jgi:hypothetical protein
VSGWTRDPNDEVWSCPVGDGTITLDCFDDEMVDYPPLVAMRAEVERYRAFAEERAGEIMRLGDLLDGLTDDGAR